ncbi:mitogen-activated protein kinase kinase kinase 5-like [Apium graveolens]|uniref:mitogen-activated protein kinase kinase kinase 5-like n=1 Tax=Apium graveolens TaxID=4045 RepID=UPI003D7A1EFF
MPFLKNVFLSKPSSSSSSSPSESPLSSTRSLGSKRKLTRQRKLRHVTEFDLGLQPVDDRSKSLPVSPNSGSLSPPNFRHWSTPAVPQPLPLPESHLGFKASEVSQSNGRGKGGEGNSSCFVNAGKSPVHVARKSPTVPTYHRRGFRQADAGEAQSFRLNVPARSAPTSGFSSPTVSPQRFRSVDILPSSYDLPREFKISNDGNVVCTSHVLPERITASPDHSPLHSPILLSPHRGTRNPSGIARHSNYKSLPESPVAWPEGNNSIVHPLPLPPGAPVPSYSPSHSLKTSHPTNGSSTKGQWQKEKLIGRGTYGSVYIAINRNDGAMCAMKEVDVVSYDSKSAECIKQLEQEIKVLQQLDHPNIVQYLGSEIIEDRFCIYLEYVHPGSVNSYVREHCGSITESVVRSFTRHILSGLAYLHSTNTIHRDIKGANLLVNASGVVKLADFGLAKHLTKYAVNLSLKGSPYWMAPEVLQSMMRNDSKPELAFAVDIWSLGCTVIEMLTGKPPWSEFNGVQALFNVLNRSPTIPETLSAEGKDFLEKCFQRNPADRPTAVQLLDHPFIRNKQDQVSSCRQEFSGLKLQDASMSPVNRNRPNLTPVSPGPWMQKGKAPSNGIARAVSYPESPDHFGTSSTNFKEHSHTKNSSTSSTWSRKSRKVQQSPYH